MLVKVQPRQLTSRPGSIPDYRGGNESIASSGVTRPQAPGRGAERLGGQANWRAATSRNVCRIENLRPREAVWWEPCGSRAPHNRAKAEVVGEELVMCTRRTAGIGGAALQERKAAQSGTVPMTSRGWCKRQGRLLMVQAAGAPPISAGHEMEGRGTGICAWARSSKERG